jgi:protein arginine N-methyltransferase 2
VVKAQDDSLLGSSDAFLNARLRYVVDDFGQEICLARSEDGTEVGVMMAWEKRISEDMWQFHGTSDF